MKFFVLTFVVLCFTATCLAQDKIVISYDPPPAAAIFPLVREAGNAQVLENPRKNETIARTKSQRVYGQDMEGLSLAAEFASNGKKVVEPKTVTLKIYYMGKDHSFVENRTIKIYVDEKELISGTSIFIRANESNVLLAALEKVISYPDFKKVSQSKNVIMQIGPARFLLTDTAIQGFKDLIQTIEQ